MCVGKPRFDLQWGLGKYNRVPNSAPHTTLTISVRGIKMSQKVKVDRIEIEGVTYVPESKAKQSAVRDDGLPFVVVRTFSAGVHCGYLKRQDGKIVVLLDAIRIWYWKGAASLSQLAMEGVKDQNESKFSVPVLEITLTEAIEVIKTTEEARKNIEGTPSWKK